MAAGSKPTAVHFSLIGFVMLSLILGVFTYLGWKEYIELRDGEFATTQAQLQQEQQSLTQLVAEVTEMKQLLGHPVDDLGGAGVDEANTVHYLVRNDLSNYGGEQAANTVTATLSAMSTRIRELEEENATLQASLNSNRDELLAVNTASRNQMDEIVQSQESSEEQLQANIDKHDEVLAEKNAEIDDLVTEINQVQAEKEVLRDEYESYRRESEERVALLENRIDALSDELNELKKVSFEKQDGNVVAVDNTTRTVWIDIGERDNLKPQVTFSVYTRDHRGIGRGPEDIKAKIEVTRVLDSHLAEARILDEQLFRPIAEGDPIYSPLWSAGRTEYFALVGRPDLDEDGESDWELFYEIVRNAGAKIDLVVTDEGDREPLDAKLSARTKFLIVGDMDDPAQFSGQPEKVAMAQAVNNQLTELRDEARLYGIRVVRLNDFLEYIGYRNQQHLWQPGQDRPFNLPSGATSAGVDEAYQDRTSSGTTSELFRQNGTRTQQESSGQTSGLFRGGR
ncbi:MAG: hypothetical protein DWQ34_14085 [Planctomycetota bacterium]|nr:MAG: hypothetical protein DWQ34_14085 [Planctomycetota bacterium]REK23820.1 MAG: hypothetical protein DWQ41_16160 [Planctomycetota bacterium]REK32897.1 MAG: hypothetical protein DWQ45_16285 [Planctomycetota bacterium]